VPRIPQHSLLKHIVMKRRSVKKIKESVFFLIYTRLVFMALALGL
jgi:hypothetical protein